MNSASKNSFLRQNRKESRRGFSLIEVVIAIGVISISLVALIGLTSASLQTGKVSAQETVMTAAGNEVLDVLRSREFTALPYTEPAPAKDVLQTATAPTVLPLVYVTADGQWLAPARSTWPMAENGEQRPDFQAAYKCVVTIEPDASTLTPKALSNPGTETCVNLLRVQAALSPVTAPETAKPTLLIHATIPRQ